MDRRNFIKNTAAVAMVPSLDIEVGDLEKNENFHIANREEFKEFFREHIVGMRVHSPGQSRLEDISEQALEEKIDRFVKDLENHYEELDRELYPLTPNHELVKDD